MTGNIWITANTVSSTIFDGGAWDFYRNAPVQARPVPPPIKHLKQDHSPNCCGADFMSWFPQPDANGLIPNKVIDQVKEQLEEHKARYNSMMLVILNNLQRPFYERMLFDQGYKVVMDHVYHPGHGHDLILYGWQKYKTSPNAR